MIYVNKPTQNAPNQTINFSPTLAKKILKKII